MQQTSHQPIRAGALTLLITTVVLCLVLLAVLSLTTARADLVLAEKHLAFVIADAQAETAGQQLLAEIDASLASGNPLPAPATRHKELIAAALPLADGHILNITLQALPQASPRYRVTGWSFSRSWTPDQSLELWPGN